MNSSDGASAEWNRDNRTNLRFMTYDVTTENPRKAESFKARTVNLRNKKHGSNLSVQRKKTKIQISKQKSAPSVCINMFLLFKFLLLSY